ncbi:nucleoside diphosphate kinase [Actinacidiphila alni]|uniref:nucleoside-diphosphate kinase n=1 Tax=Actinacidiphila alni TaxID=380248 RepID=A0A1I2LDP5_9ACTN|nr:nucleoside-diphosphate kinase [Actinacidiphila alni]SFF75301.1 nucleoside diphosphate kinase [Actinacidiphila alni]
MTAEPARSALTGPDWECWSVVLCKPDAVERGLAGTVLARLAPAGVRLTGRRDVRVLPWQIHVHYWDLLVDDGRFPGRDIPACLEAEYAGRTVTVALAHGAPGIHQRLRDLLGHFDPAKAKPGTIRADLGQDSLAAALTEQRLIRNLVHTSDDAHAARRDFGTWYGAAHRGLLLPRSRTTPAR